MENWSRKKALIWGGDACELLATLVGRGFGRLLENGPRAQPRESISNPELSELMVHMAQVPLGTWSLESWCSRSVCVLTQLFVWNHGRDANETQDFGNPCSDPAHFIEEINLLLPLGILIPSCLVSSLDSLLITPLKKPHFTQIDLSPILRSLWAPAYPRVTTLLFSHMPPSKGTAPPHPSQTQSQTLIIVSATSVMWKQPQTQGDGATDLLSHSLSAFLLWNSMSLLHMWHHLVSILCKSSFCHLLPGC